jgi:CheY-like chemotaxis protein
MTDNPILIATEPTRPVAMRILVIEDEKQLAGHITRALARRGHNLATQYDGVAGLRTALSDPQDLIVLDLNLPICDVARTLGVSTMDALAMRGYGSNSPVTVRHFSRGLASLGLCR